MGLLNQKNQFSIYAGLQGLHALSARYEFELKEERLPLYQIIRESFPVLVSLVNDMIKNKDNSDALYILYLIMKVFHKCN